VTVGAGRTSAAIAAALDAACPDVDLSGVVVTRCGHAAPAVLLFGGETTVSIGAAPAG
jgi:glycerate-2-kinase